LKFSYYGADYNEDLYEKKAGTEFTLAELIDRVLASTPERPTPYFRNKVLSEISPRLLQDIQPLPEYVSPNWIAEPYLVKQLRRRLNRGSAIELFIGGEGGASPVLHYDGYGSHAFLMQIYGRKEYVVYLPEQEQVLYPVSTHQSISFVDVSSPDLGKYPLFRNAEPTTLILEPGEMLFIPSHWWHTVRMLTPSITIAVNVLNQSNWHELVRFVTQKRHNLFEVLPILAYLRGAGAWRAWRDWQWRQRVYQRAA
jgi:hypothetical protein